MPDGNASQPSQSPDCTIVILAVALSVPSTAPRISIEDKGYSTSLPYFVPLAIEQLRDDPLVAGDFYCGDLLKIVVGIAAPFWAQHPDFQREVEVIAQRALALLPQVKDIAEFLARDIKQAINQFRQASQQ